MDSFGSQDHRRSQNWSQNEVVKRMLFCGWIVSHLPNGWKIRESLLSGWTLHGIRFFFVSDVSTTSVVVDQRDGVRWFSTNLRSCKSAFDRSRVWWTKIHLGASKNRGGPKASIKNRVFHYKPSILGYHYFWKHPFSKDVYTNHRWWLSDLYVINSIIVAIDPWFGPSRWWPGLGDHDDGKLMMPILCAFGYILYSYYSNKCVLLGI